MRRRAIAVLAAVGLAATALFGAAPAASANGVGGVAYVALGDSMASGNGNLPYVDQECLRSARSYPVQISTALGLEMVSAACTGATTWDVFSPGNLPAVPPSGQVIDLWAAGTLGPATQLVTLTVGLNDLGWQDALLVCATGSTAACNAAVAQMAANAQTLPARLISVLSAIRGTAPNATILVTGYAKLFGTVEKKFCAIGNLDGVGPVKLPADLTAGANAIFDGVNYALGATTAQFAAQDGNTWFINVDPAFATHRLCDTGDRWISGLIRGVPIDRGLHPNAAGMTAFANSVLNALP